MKITVYKYPLINPSEDGIYAIPMPSSSHVVLVAMQGSTMCIWAQVLIDNPMVVRKFTVYGTGEPIPEFRIPVGSVIDGPFVWHLYEVLQ